MTTPATFTMLVSEDDVVMSAATWAERQGPQLAKFTVPPGQFVPSIDDVLRMQANASAYRGMEKGYDFVAVIGGVETAHDELPTYSVEEEILPFPVNCGAAMKRLPDESWDGEEAPPLIAEKVLKAIVASWGIKAFSQNPGGAFFITLHGRTAPLSGGCLYYHGMSPYAVQGVKTSGWVINPHYTYAAGSVRQEAGACSWFSPKHEHAFTFGAGTDLRNMVQNGDGTDWPYTCESGWVIQIVAAFECPQVEALNLGTNNITWPVPISHLLFRVVPMKGYKGTYLLPRMIIHFGGNTCCACQPAVTPTVPRTVAESLAIKRRRLIDSVSMPPPKR